MSTRAFTPKAVRPVVGPPSLHVCVQKSIKDYIRDNRLKPGDALPPEGALAQQLGVGCNSVREALPVLESIGFLKTRRGEEPPRVTALTRDQQIILAVLGERYRQLYS